MLEEMHHRQNFVRDIKQRRSELYAELRGKISGRERCCVEAFEPDEGARGNVRNLVWTGMEASSRGRFYGSRMEIPEQRLQPVDKPPVDEVD